MNARVHAWVWLGVSVVFLSTGNENGSSRFATGVALAWFMVGAIVDAIKSTKQPTKGSVEP